MKTALVLLMLWAPISVLAVGALCLAFHVTHRVDDMFGEYERRTPEPPRLWLIRGDRRDVFDQDTGGDAA